MSRKGHYNGGSTIIRPGNSSWFGKKVPKWAKRKPTDAAPKRPLSLAEQAAFKVLKESRETGTRLIPKGQADKQKRRYGKTKVGVKKPLGIKPEPSRPQKDVAVITQALRHGKSRTIAVEFVSERKPQRRNPIDAPDG